MSAQRVDPHVSAGNQGGPYSPVSRRVASEESDNAMPGPVMQEMNMNPGTYSSNPFASSGASEYHYDEPSRGADSFSLHSAVPLAPRAGMNRVSSDVPPMPAAASPSPGMPVAHDYAKRPPLSQSTTGLSHRPGASSWDLLAGLRKFESDYEGYDARNAKEEHLRFAQGDMPNNKLSKLYNYLLNVSIVTRWALYILPVLALLWIPGILGLTAAKDTRVWNVKLIFWSIWLSVFWGSWWGSLAVARMLPNVAKNTIGVVAVGTRKYFDWLTALSRYVALFSWTLVSYISFNPLIDARQSPGGNSQISLIAKLLFGVVICTGLLLFEKFSIQWIASKFHERSYAERIADQKLAVRVLVVLYSHSAEVAGHGETQKEEETKANLVDPRRFFKKALKGVKVAATTTTTALGNVASEIAGSSVLQPNSPQAKVQEALRNVNRTRALARRLFYSFRRSGRDFLLPNDIAQFFPSEELAHTAFGIFDKDGNGDVSREEIELACLDIHREQMSIEHSMRDLDSAVGRLDNIFMSLYVVIAGLIIAVVLDAQFTSVLTGAGTTLLGLSWLIGSSLQEVLSSIIFLFIKHPYDVGDRVTITKESFTVKEIRLLSTIFLDSNNCLVQAPHSVMTTQMIHNIRRSPQMSETFEFEVAYDTSFEQVERLRTKMLAFVKAQSRDFLPSFDVVVKDIPEQEKMLLSADIKYKSNWQQGAVKVKRRNMWICAMKTALGELEIFGPSGNPGAKPAPKKYTEVPWEEVKREEHEAEMKAIEKDKQMPHFMKKQYSLSDKNAAAVEDAQAFDEQEQVYAATSRMGVGSSGSSTVASSQVPSRTATGLPMPAPANFGAHTLVRTPEEFEMSPPSEKQASPTKGGSSMV